MSAGVFGRGLSLFAARAVVCGDVECADDVVQLGVARKMIVSVRVLVRGRRSCREIVGVAGNLVAAVLFGDVHGFSALNDEQLPRFVDTVLGAFGQVVDCFREDVRLVNTWGDGLFLVFDDAGTAAACASACRKR